MADRRVRLILEAQVDQYNQSLRQSEQQTESFGQSLRGAVESREMQQLGRGLAAFGTASVAALGAAAKSAIDWESDWTNVMRRTEGTPQQLAALEEGLRGIAREMPATHAEIAEVAASASQLGVAVEDIEGFTRVMIQMGSTTDMSADQAATTMQRFANVMGTSTSDMDRLGSSIVDLGNNSATTESEIATMGQRLAGAGRQMGMTEGDVLGIAAALSSVGIQAAAGGTAVSRTMYNIDGAVREGGEALERFGQIAGMSAQEFGRLWEEDAAMGLEAFVSGLGRIREEGGSVQQALAELGVNEVRTVAALSQMAAAGDLMADSIQRGNNAFEENIAMQAEYSHIAESSQGRITVAWNQIRDAMIDVGAVVVPMIVPAIEAVSDLVAAFTELPTWAQNAAVGLGGVVGVLSLLAGSAILLAPNLMAASRGLGAITAAVPGAQRLIGGLTRTAGLAAVGFLALQAAGVAFRIGVQDARDDVADLAATLADFTGTASQQHTLLRDLTTSQASLGVEIEGLSHAFQVLDTHTERSSNGWGQWITGAGAIAGMLPGFTTDTEAAAQSIEAMDTAVSDLVRAGDLQAAADGFYYAAEQGAYAGRSVDQVAASLPELERALQLAGIEMDDFTAAATDTVHIQENMQDRVVRNESAIDDLAASLGLGADETDALAAELEALEAELEDTATAAERVEATVLDMVAALFDAGLATMDSRDAAMRYHDTLRSVEDQVKELTDENGRLQVALNDSATDFDLTTESGATANATFQQLARDGMREVEALATEGVGQDELQAKLEQTMSDLRQTAQDFGLNEEAARDLTREIMGIPDGVDIDTWMDETALQVARELNGELDRADGRHTRSTHTHTVRQQQTGVQGRHNPDALRGFARGGYATPGWALVGEEGPELVNFSEPARVYTTAETRTALGGTLDAIPSRAATVPARSLAPVGGAASSGPVTAVLAAEDRALLREVADRPVSVEVDGREFARTAARASQQFQPTMAGSRP